MYQLIRPLLFSLDPETAHATSLKSLKMTHQLGLTRFLPHPSANPCQLFGLHFPNPIGLAAGVDKNAEYVDALSALGFGFIEVGTVTPLPQTGNPRPRLFRLTDQEALINRMGFPSKGMEYVAAQLEKTRYKGILGINIGKNRDTPIEHASDDYLTLFKRLWKYASYITVNVSSPNTIGLRQLQQADLLNQLIDALKQEQQRVVIQHQKYVPLIIKISPDLSEEELSELASVLLKQKIGGVIATNASIHRDGVLSSPYAKETGGLSGKPLQARATHCVARLHTLLHGTIPIIAVGGIMDEKSGKEKIQAGAKLLQIYTGFIYRGPALIRRLAGITHVSST